MIRCGKTGAALLYGTKCAGCDCVLAGLADGGFVRDTLAMVAQSVGAMPAGRVMGFDTASKPDQTATIKGQRVSDRYEYRIEDIEAATHPDLERLIRERAAHMSRMREAAFARSMWGDCVDPPWGFEAPPRHANCRSRVDPRYGDGTAWTPPAQEIITDPADRRGMDARLVRGL